MAFAHFYGGDTHHGSQGTEVQPAGPEMGGLERAPIQNSPWKETSLDHPYEKPRKSSEAGSESRSGKRKGGLGAGGIWGRGRGWALVWEAFLRVMLRAGIPGWRHSCC